MTQPQPGPPAEPLTALAPAGRALWEKITAAWELNAAEAEILFQACATADLVDFLALALVDSPMTVKGSAGQPRANPMLAAVAEQRRTLAALLGSLDLPDVDERGREAERAEWARRHAGRRA